MKKSTFLILAGIAAAGTMFFECSDTYSSEAIRRAELTGTPSETKQKEKTAHIITLKSDSISVIDPETGKTIFTDK